MFEKTKPLVDKENIKLAILGLTPGNGHPYSWSAMFNGYDTYKGSIQGSSNSGYALDQAGVLT